VGRAVAAKMDGDQIQAFRGTVLLMESIVQSAWVENDTHARTHQY
jgi:hypothetical protein